MDQSANKPPTLLDELDQRQNVVIQQLDELNERIETTLKSWTDARSIADQKGA